MSLYLCPTVHDVFDDETGEPTGIRVEWRDTDSWAVTQGRWCLNTDGEFEMEPLPSSRTDEWKAAHRFDLGQAMNLALEKAKELKGGS